MRKLMECVPNFSEGRDLEIVEKIIDEASLPGKSQKSLNFLCFCGYYNRQMSAKYYNGQILKNIFLYNYIAG